VLFFGNNKKRSCPKTGPHKANQQPEPQIWLRICQMELQQGLQTELQEKKNILPTSFSEFASRRQDAL